jgi:molybdate transport system substrate-binding protein
MKTLFVIAATLALAASAAPAAELKVLSGNGAKAAVRELCAQFERASGNKIHLRFEVNADLKTKIEAGEAFDVAVLNPPVIDALIKSGKIAAGSRTDIGRSGLGVAVKSGAPKPRYRHGRGLQAHAARRQVGRLSGQGGERPLFRQPARPHGH